MASVFSLPISASLTIPTTLSSVVSFCQPTYPKAPPTVAVLRAVPAPFNVCCGCSTALPVVSTVAAAPLPIHLAAFVPSFNNDAQLIVLFFHLWSNIFTYAFPSLKCRSADIIYISLYRLTVCNLIPNIPHRGVFDSSCKSYKLLVHDF